MPILDKGVWRTDINQLDEIDHFPTQIVPEKDRYHFYYSYGCPFAHRANLVLHYLGLNHVISSSGLAPEMLENGWTFNEVFKDDLFGSRHLHEIYTRAKADYSGKVSLPVLWDKKVDTIASHDSAELAFHLATQWQDFAQHSAELVSPELHDDILAMNEWLNSQITMKVYQVGLANSQVKYEHQLEKLFQNLIALDERLSENRYLFGNQITLSDFFLFPTLIRFETVYADLYKTNLKPLSEFKNLYRYMVELYQHPRIKPTVDVAYTQRFYYISNPILNPSKHIPLLPDLVWLR